MKFEFLNRNLLNTSTLLSVSANTSSAINLYDRNKNDRWNSDTITSLVTVSLPSTQTVDRIVLQNTNLKDFTVYYNGTTTNLFSLTATSDTVSSDWTGNTQSDLYLVLASSTAISSIGIVCSNTTDSASSYIGEFWIADKLYALPENPNYRGYKPSKVPKQFEHKMSDGGIKKYFIHDVFQGDIKLKYQTATVITELESIFDMNDSFLFVPFPTATNWGSKIYDVNWVGKWDFDRLSGNYPIAQGYEGAIRLKEIPK